MGRSEGRCQAPRTAMSAVFSQLKGLACVPQLPAAKRPSIPIKAVAPAASACADAAPFALMVLGDSMSPEFQQGDIVIIEPEGHATDGSYVLAFIHGEWIFRQLRRCDEGWRLNALNPGYAQIDLPDLQGVRGVIIQKNRPGRRRDSKRYVG
jgi:SOS-response transcriptional repressor LexA